jgi:ectoine hydroxylase-related dioxygenase (phytanoyl-CoA dioxygenase family)
MNDEERYLFDLQGYIILRNVIDAPTLTRMNAWCDAQADRDPKWQGGIGNDHLDYPITWGEDFLALLDHPRVMPYLMEIMGSRIRLDHDYGIFLKPGHKGLPLHGPTRSLPYDPLHYYHFIKGRMCSGLSVATFALTDVPEGSGGMCVINGSHKVNYLIPEDIRTFERESPIVQQIAMQAGDCAIFTEALWHGTLPWKGPGVRRTLFLKYAPHPLAWANEDYVPARRIETSSEWFDGLNPTQRELLSPPSSHDFRTPIVLSNE